MPKFHHCIILSIHEVFIPCCPLLCIHPHLVYQIKVQAELFLVILVLILHYPVIGHMYFCRYDCFTSVCQLKRSFSRWGFHCHPIGPQNTWQLIWLYSLCPFKSSLDDLQQGSVCYFCLTICLGVGGRGIMILNFKVFIEVSEKCVIKLSSVV